MEQNNKTESLQVLVSTLTTENETLYHQLNHLMIRNNTLLKRIDDLQQAVNDLHIRLQESNLINNNLIKANDHIKAGYDNRNVATSLLRTQPSSAAGEDILESLDLEELYLKWKMYPGQEAKNSPNIRKQMSMLANLYSKGKLKASDLFYHSGIGAVTGARYVATLKKAGLIEYTGARKKGHYSITKKGRDFVDTKMDRQVLLADNIESNTLLQGIPLSEDLGIPTTNMMDHFDL
jgi:predicted transcriptional regulator